MAAASHDEPLYLGIDVGTGSARAALFSASGALLGAHARATTTFRSPADARVFEQSTDDIWACIAECSRAVLRDAHAAPARVKGVGFDATCSLAVVDGAGSPVAVSPTPQGWAHGTQNVILWADHRAEQEAHEINASRSRVLDFVGGTMSLEMELPKILHLARRMPPALFAQCHFYDLPDFLTWRATGSRARSHCSLVCKCAYVPPGVVADGGSSGWQQDLLRQLGLGQLVDEGYARLGGAPDGDGVILTAGQPVAQGLSARAAAELGLLPGTAVGSALIDAYAGWVGTVAAPATNGPSAAAAVAAGLEASEGRLAAIAGTSTCHVLQSTQGIKVKGVWGPYKNAVFPGMWMNEGGQSSTGQLIDFMIDSHPASPALKAACASTGTSVFEALHAQLDAQRLAAGVAHDSYLTTHLHLYPDLHGNRSPLADPSMRGLLDGLALDASVHDLARVYFATLEAIALQTRQIITALRQEGHRIDALYMSGGHTRNLVFMQLLADVCAIPVQLPASSSTSVVLGAAMLGRFAHETSDGAALESQAAAEAHAHKHADRLWHTMVDMSKPGTFVFPSGDAALTRLLDAKYAIFLDAIATQRRWRAAMDAAVQPLPAAAA